jgi:hypothetical protein
VVEAIADRAVVISLFQINKNAQTALFDLNFSRIIDSRTIDVPA